MRKYLLFFLATLYICALVGFLVFYFVSLAQADARCAAIGSEAVSTTWSWICVEGITP